MMKRWSSRRLSALLLAVFLALGMTLSAVQASDMAAKMAMASNMGATGQGGCDACGGGDDGNTKADTCIPMCTASVPALLPSGFVATAPDVADPHVPGYRFVRGRTPSPDPYPPRFTDFG